VPETFQIAYELNRFREESEMLDFLVVSEAVRQKTRASVEPARESASKRFWRRHRRETHAEHAQPHGPSALHTPRSAESA